MKQYSFIQEANWAMMAGNAIGKLQKSNAHRGALAGAAIGAGVNVAKNAMKSDDDKTKKGVIRSALGGATTGAMVGAGAGLAAGKLARTNAANKLQNTLAVKAKDIAGDQAAKKHLYSLGSAAFDKDNNITKSAQQGMDAARKKAMDNIRISKGGLTGKGLAKGRQIYDKLAPSVADMQD